LGGLHANFLIDSWRSKIRYDGDMNTLRQHLEHRTWRELRATAHAHGLHFNTNHTTLQARERLYRELTGGQLRRSFRALGPDERAALVALQAAGGLLPFYRFTAAFGPIRPYKPWQEDAPVHPWRRPVSVAERLWFLGFVQINKGQNGPRMVSAPAEVLSLLPPLPRPRPKAKRLPRPVFSPDALRVDLAILLGTLLGTPVKPRWSRWLPPYMLKRINARLRVREKVDAVRSELQTKRLRFLHYLAEVSGLLSAQNGVFLPTTAAWAWLSLPPGEQWRWLWGTVTRGLGGRCPVWSIYRFPPVTAGVWQALIDQLRSLTPDRTYTITSLLDALRPYCPSSPNPFSPWWEKGRKARRAASSSLSPRSSGREDLGVRGTGENDPLESVPEILRGALSWAGIVTVCNECFMLTDAGYAALHGDDCAFAPVEYATIQPSEDALWLNLPDVPPTRAWTEFAAWGTLDQGRWCVDAESVARAVEQGHHAHDIVRIVGDLCGGMLPRDQFERIEEWVKQASRLVLQQMTVLTSPDADLLASLRQDRRLRAMFAEPLSAFHSAVRPHAARTLDQHLTRRGYRVTMQIASPQMPPPGDLAPEMAEYLWLAARVYHDLSAFVDLPARIPAAVLHDLAARLPEGRTDDLQRTAGTVRESLARTIDGYAALPPPITQDDPAAIRDAVQRAYEQRGKLTIEYFSPGYGAATIRTIAPLLPITESGGAEYVEAWCSTADAARTFRLDRIMRLVDPGD
jgi:hypothetical protein